MLEYAIIYDNMRYDTIQNILYFLDGMTEVRCCSTKVPAAENLKLEPANL